MNRAWPTTAKILTGFFVTAMYAMPQAYTVSAKPGVINYIEGKAFVNGRPVSSESLRALFLNANDVVSTGIGKAEVLLSPGVFLRVADNSEVRMVSPSLTDTTVELKSGDAMVEADDIVKDNHVTVMVGGSSALIEKNGLYRFTAGDAPSVAVLEGKATVSNGDRKTDLGKGKEVLLGQDFKTKKFDSKQQDELFAWSNVRAEYNAASSYQAARDVNSSGYGGVWGGYGYSGFSNTGWMWNAGFNSYSWLPGNGAFYSPFGFGFYSPGMIGYAPVIYAPIYGGGYYGGGNYRGGTANSGTKLPNRPVPVNPVNPPAIGRVTSSLTANQAARSQAIQTYAATGGFRTASGVSVPAGRAAAFSYSASNSGRASVSSGAGVSTGSVGRASSGVSGSASSMGGGSHSGGSGSSGGASHH